MTVGKKRINDCVTFPLGTPTTAGISTYCEEDVDHIHEAQNDVSDLGLVVAVAHRHERARDDVVREHLPVVLAPLLHVYHEDLLQPKGELQQVVALHQAAHLARREVIPDFIEVEPVRRVVVDVLRVAQNG